MSKDYNVTVKVRNARILNALANVDSTFGIKLAKQLGVPYKQLLDLVNLKIQPVDKHGDWLPAVMKLSEYTHTMPVDLFADAQFYPVDSNVAEFEMGQDEVMQLLNDSHAADPTEAIEYIEKQQAVHDVVDTLTPREAEIINLRFGLTGKEHTLEEIAQMQGVRRERIRQIEAKALRKLRHPSRADILREKIHNVDVEKLQQQREREEAEEKRTNEAHADRLAAILERKEQREFETAIERERTQWHSALSPPPDKNGLYERRVNNHHAYCIYLDGVWLIGDTKIANALAEMLHKRPSTYLNTEWREIPKNNMTPVETRLLEKFINSLERETA